MCTGEVEGGSCDLSITRQLRRLASDTAMDVFTIQSVMKSVGLRMGTLLGRTTSTLQRLMVILMKLNIKWEWERRGVITERVRHREQEEGWHNRAGSRRLSFLATTSHITIDCIHSVGNYPT